MRFVAVLSLALAVVCLCNGYPQGTVQRSIPIDQEAEPSTQDDSDMYMEPIDDPKTQQKSSPDANQDSQNFYPSFAQYNDQPLGHSRPFYYQPEAAYSHRPTAYQQHVGYDTARISGFKGDFFEDRSPNENSILGSGNFGVIKGGTFYNDRDNSESDEFDYDGSYSFYHNGHGRPSSFYYGNNRRPTQHEQFENFRDFADINTPSYSHFVVVYANKNGTKKIEENGNDGDGKDDRVVVVQPKNILEHLALLDLESKSNSKDVTTERVGSVKKLSKTKAKLAKLFMEKKSKSPKKTIVISTKQNSKDLYEPLLALS